MILVHPTCCQLVTEEHSFRGTTWRSFKLLTYLYILAFFFLKTLNPSYTKLVLHRYFVPLAPTLQLLHRRDSLPKVGLLYCGVIRRYALFLFLFLQSNRLSYRRQRWNIAYHCLAIFLFILKIIPTKYCSFILCERTT